MGYNREVPVNDPFKVTLAVIRKSLIAALTIKPKHQNDL